MNRLHMWIQIWMAVFILAGCGTPIPSTPAPGDDTYQCPISSVDIGDKQELIWIPSGIWDLFHPTPEQKLEIEKNPEMYTMVENRSLSVWSPDEDHANINTMTLSLSLCPTADACLYENRIHKYIGGELQSEYAYSSGRLEATFQAIKGDGVVTSLFTYGQKGNELLNEIDIEILGKDTTTIELNYFVGDLNHPMPIHLENFDAAAEPHRYAIEWDYEGIYWYVDDECIHFAPNNHIEPFISHSMYLMMNVWVSNSKAWAGEANSAKLFPAADTKYSVTYSNVQFFGYQDDNTDDPVVEKETILIPAGEFQMGCDPNHNAGYDCTADTLPLHTVYLGDFSISKTEVTNQEYKACVDAGVCSAPHDYSSATHSDYFGNREYNAFPVIHVDWNQAQTYCNWIGGRLPTEAEWEKAAKGTTLNTYPWGDTLPTCSLTNWATLGSCNGDTVAVGSYPDGASIYGVVDLSGNVWEWVSDWYREDYYQQTTSQNPTGPDDGTYRVIRGAGWGYGDSWSNYQPRSVNRSMNDPVNENFQTGFRCIITP